MKNVKGKNVLVTGAARGMGRLWAEKFLQDGAKLILWDLDKKELRNTKAELEKKYSTDIIIDSINVTEKSKVYGSIFSFTKANGPINVLVNNAGVVAGGEFLKVPDDKQEAVIDINLKSIMWTMKAVLPGMMEKGSGHIVNISSAAGLIGTPFMASYNASKWGVIGLTESVKLELEELGFRNIKFTLVCPSYVNTGMFKGVKEPFFLPLLSQEKLVDKAYRAFKKDKYMLLEPLLVKFIPLLRGVLSNSAFNSLSKWLGVSSSMQNWQGRGK